MAIGEKISFNLLCEAHQLHELFSEEQNGWSFDHHSDKVKHYWFTLRCLPQHLCELHSTGAHACGLVVLFRGAVRELDQELRGEFR